MIIIIIIQLDLVVEISSEKRGSFRFQLTFSTFDSYSFCFLLLLLVLLLLLFWEELLRCGVPNAARVSIIITIRVITKKEEMSREITRWWWWC